MIYHWLINNIGSISDIILYILVFLTILVLIKSKYNKDKYLDNWQENRCKPYIIPISGFLKKDESQTVMEATMSNFNGCFWGMIKGYFNILIKPIVYILDIIKALLSNLTKSIDVMRAQLKIMRNMILGIVMKMMKRLEHIMEAATFSYSKINEVTKRQLAVYQNVMYLMQTISVTMAGFANGTMGKIIDMSTWASWVLPIFTLGPIGAIFPAMAFCFHPDTLINNTKIKDVLLGTQINENSIVISKMCFNVPKNMSVFNHNNTIVSGWHYVYEENKWIKVCDSTNSKETYLDTDTLYTLNTTNNIININGNIYRDFDEKNISEDANNLILNILNSEKKSPNRLTNNAKNKRYRFGFSKNTKVNNEFIQNITLSENVTGIIEHMPVGDELFYEINNVICSEYTKIFVNNRWINVRDIGKPIIYTDNYYSIVTKDHNIYINGIIFRDFIELERDIDIELLDKLYSS
jgi:hypothetical protein